MPPAPEVLTVPAADGYPLAATRYGGTDARRVVLIAPATGVRRRLYDAFATYLAAAGFGVLTWDWRGTGDSRPAGGLRGFPATMRDWATLDLAGAIEWATSRFPGAALLCVGHSFGGQALGLAPNAARVRALVTVAAQSGYWRHWPVPARYGYALLWYAGMPLLARALGYFPSRRLGLGEDLPRGVALDWARWCRRPEYLGDWAGHAAYTAPVLSFGFSDDPFAPPRAVEALHVRYGSRARRHRHVRPAELGLRRIGHFGFFRPTAEGLWGEVVEWLEGGE